MSTVPFFLLFFAAVVAFAAWRGGGPERMVAGAYSAALLASATLGLINLPGEFESVPARLFLVDLLLLLTLCLLTIRANRWWLIPAAACQLVLVSAHVVRLTDLEMIPRGYAFLTKVWSWPMVALLALGTWAHRRRLARGIIVPDWKPSFGRRGFRTRPVPRPD